MKYRILGTTGLEISVIGMGTWQFGGEWGKDFTQAEVDAMCVAAREEGINLIDTAECYGDHLSERLVGTALERVYPGEREKWIIATKFGHRFTGPFQRDRLWDPASVRTQLEDSLRALRTEYVDLLQFHSGTDEEFLTNGLWEELAKLREEGKVRHLGVSIGSNRNVVQTGQARELGAEAIQLIYNRLDREPEDEVFDICARDRLGVLARVPLASGFLSGKYKPGASFPHSDVRSRRPPQKNDSRLEEVQRIAEEEVPEGVPMAEWALAWCLRNPAVSAVIPGCKSVEQVRSNARAAELA